MNSPETSRLPFSFSQEALSRFCQRHHILRLELFGSALRRDFGPDSDIDILVDFEPGFEPGLLQMVDVELELSALIGFHVDLVERSAVEQSPNYIRRRHILQSLEPLYVA